MNAVSRTNLYHSHLLRLVQLCEQTSNTESVNTLCTSFVLMIERALCALLLEQAEVKDSDSAVLSNLSFSQLVDHLLSESEQGRWVLNLLKEGLNNDDHWLNEWRSAHGKLDEIGHRPQSNHSMPIALVDLDRLSETDRIRQWLTEFGVLVADCRSINDFN